MGVAGWSCAARAGRLESTGQRTINAPHQHVISFAPCRPCELVGRALRDNTTDVSVAQRHGALGRSLGGLNTGLEGEDAETRPTQRTRYWMRGAESQESGSTKVVARTSVPKSLARLASCVVCARLVTVAVPPEVKHTVRARGPLRRGSAGASSRGLRPLDLATFPRDCTAIVVDVCEFD